MTHLTYPVLASLALLGACSYEVTLFGGGGGDTPAFDATKIGDLVKSLARDSVGEPSAVRCPPKMQFVPRDRYTCELDVDGATYKVNVRHKLHMAAVASWDEPVYGNEPLAKNIEAAFSGRGLDVDCRGVVVTRARPQGQCKIDDDRWVMVTLKPDELSFNIVEWKGGPM